MRHPLVKHRYKDQVWYDPIWDLPSRSYLNSGRSEQNQPSRSNHGRVTSLDEDRIQDRSWTATKEVQKDRS